jgi:hypothetical protein
MERTVSVRAKGELEEGREDVGRHRDEGNNDWEGGEGESERTLPFKSRIATSEHPGILFYLLG